VFIDGYGVDQIVYLARPVAIVSLPEIIPVVFPSCATGVLKVDLLSLHSAGVGDVESACQFVEGDSPGIAQSHCPDFRAVTVYFYEGITVRDGIGSNAGFHIDAQEFAQQGAWLLRIEPIRAAAAAAAVATTDVEVAVSGTERHGAAVVTLTGLRDGKQDLLAIGIGDVGIGGGLEATDNGMRGTCITHVEMPAVQIG